MRQNPVPRGNSDWNLVGRGPFGARKYGQGMQVYSVKASVDNGLKVKVNTMDLDWQYIHKHSILVFAPRSQVQPYTRLDRPALKQMRVSTMTLL